MMTKWLRQQIYIIRSVLAVLLLTACDIHQFPEEALPPDPEELLNASLDMKHQTAMYVWEHFYDPTIGRVVESKPNDGVDEQHPGTSMVYSPVQTEGFKHITARIYKKGSLGAAVVTKEFYHDLWEGYDLELPVTLVPGDYEAVVWSDLREEENQNRYYEPTNFNSIKVNYDWYQANTDYRDAYRGRASFTIKKEGDRATVKMHRPMAKYEFITTDLSEFLERETARRQLTTRATMDDYVVKIYYSTYCPSAYSAFDDRLENSATGIGFTTQVTITGVSEASLGFDYVFINDIVDGGVQTTIVVYDLAGNTVAQSVQITVPLRRNHHTYLRGAFLTMNGSGGIGIDPGFNGDHNMTIH